MKNQKLGYARVSTLDQNLSRQIDMLNQYGVDRLYTEKMSGTKRNRPELTKLLAHMDEGDTVVIESLSRLGRSTKDLIASRNPLIPVHPPASSSSRSCQPWLSLKGT